MTAQIDDHFFFKDKGYAISGISAGEFFSPAIWGLEPVGTCSACWQGYQAIFALSDSQLVLDDLSIQLFSDSDKYIRQEGPAINGVSPINPVDKNSWFNNIYRGLKYNINYTGGLLLTEGFIDDLYRHMGFHPAWKYEYVIELFFLNGILQHQFDRSRQIADIRKNIIADGFVGYSPESPTHEEVQELLDGSFERTYKMFNI